MVAIVYAVNNKDLLLQKGMHAAAVKLDILPRLEPEICT
jgi:hypothetical protein